MIGIEPIDISLVSTNVAADSSSEWSDATTYTVGDQVKVTSVEPHKVYESLRANNLDKSPPDYIDAVEISTTSSTSNTVGTGSLSFTVDTGLSLVAGQVVEISKIATPLTVNMEGEVTSYTSGTGVLVVSVYSSTGSGTHTDWKIVSADEVGFWKEIGATNQYKMFDEYLNTETSNSTSIVVQVEASRVDCISLLGLEGVSVEAELWDSTETTLLWSEEVSLIYGSATLHSVADWYEYFFGEYSASSEVVLYPDVSAADALLNITITAATGGTAKCGKCLIGRRFEAGKTQFGCSAGMEQIVDEETDDEGQTKAVSSYYVANTSQIVRIENRLITSVFKKLKSLIDTPTVWVGVDTRNDCDLFIVYGMLADFTLTVQGTTHSFCSIEIKGLL